MAETIQINSQDILDFCWNPSILDTPSFVVCGGAKQPNEEATIIQVWAYSEKHDAYIKIKDFGNSQHDQDLSSIQTVTWAPFIGRPYHLLATSSAAQIILWKCGFLYQEGSREVSEFSVELLQTIDLPHGLKVILDSEKELE